MGKRRLYRLVTCLVLFLSIVASYSVNVFAYNVQASHEVNVSDVDKEEAQKKIWDALRSDGYSEYAAAGILGNLCQESYCCDYTCTQGRKSWSSFVKGKTGLGIAQWTSSGRQDGLFAKADERGTQWTDLDTQIAYLFDELNNGGWWGIVNSFSSLGDFKANCSSIEEATITFEKGFEGAGIPLMDARIYYAYNCYNQLTGRSVSKGQGSDDSSVAGGTKAIYSKLIDEYDLEGMPQKGILSNGVDKVFILGSDSLSTSEQYTVAMTREDILDRKSFRIWDNVRIGVTFLGLCIILYTVLLNVAYLFDRSNNFIDLQLVRVLTLGNLRYTEENVGSREDLTKGRLIKSSVISLVVGFLIVSGSILNIVGDIVISIQSTL